MPEERDLYKHYKGKIYKIVCIANNAGNGTPCVVYKNVNERIDPLTHVLPLNEFLGYTDNHVKRFEYLVPDLNVQSL